MLKSMGSLEWWSLFHLVWFISFIMINVQSNGLHARSSLLLNLSRVHLVSYVDVQYTDVVCDGLYLNRLYANAHGYMFTVANGSDNEVQHPSDPVNHSKSVLNVGRETDPRWEKVAVVHNLMQQYLDHPLPYPAYICWFDADLFFLDFSKSLDDFFDVYPAYDMIVSAEVHAETGVANTGLFIMRCSTWSLLFLQSWWDQDHSIGHDQILFDTLYKSLWPGIEDHIKVLAANKLNTIPPAYNTLQQSDFVLHLMGERNDYRQQVFSYARQLVDDYLNSSDGNRSLRSINLYQLGVNQSYLANSFFDLTMTHIDASHILLQSDSKELSLDEVITKAEEYRELMLQHLKVVHSPSFHTSTLLHILSNRLSKHEQIYTCLKQRWNNQIDTYQSYSSIQLIKLLNLLSMLANDLLQEMQLVITGDDTHNDILRLYQEAESWLQLLLVRVDHHSQSTVYAMIAMLYQNKALFFSSNDGLRSRYSNEIILLYQNAVQIYADSIPFEIANKYQYASLTQHYAEALAEYGHDYKIVNYYYHISCQSWEMLLYGENTWKEDHNHYTHLLLHAIKTSLPEVELTKWHDKLQELRIKFPSEVGAILKIQKQHITAQEVYVNDFAAPFQDSSSKKRFRRKRSK